MPASLNLLPRKCFEITLEDGTIIPGKYGTWALKRFCDKKGTGLSGLSAMLASPELGDIVDFILCAVEQKAREENAKFSYTDVQACMWIDQLGGAGSADFVALFNHSGSEDEKKSPAIVEDNQSNGQHSNVLPQVQE